MARAKNEDEGQGEMFPELADTPEHKKILRTAKALYKIREERKAALLESKAREDKKQEELVALMHAENIERFTYDGVKVEIKKNTEKVKVKLLADDEDEGGEGEGTDEEEPGEGEGPEA